MPRSEGGHVPDCPWWVWRSDDATPVMVMTTTASRAISLLAPDDVSGPGMYYATQGTPVKMSGAMIGAMRKGRAL